MIRNLLSKFLGVEKMQSAGKEKEITENQSKTWVPPGHFYSPIPSMEEIRSRESKIFNEIPRELPSIDLNEKNQLKLFDKFKEFYREQPFEAHRKDGLRYFFENPAYLYSDAIFLHCMVRQFRPRKIIEIGSGYSSCVILDTNELFFNNEIDCTFIEPYPQLLLSLLKASDLDRVEIISSNLQDVLVEKFDDLSAGDFLFIDSTHVTKTDSDVNYIFFKILPHIKAGVYVHFHDIFYPFEYPKEWVYEGRSWNEAYILRAFLQFNNSFEIIFFNTFLEYFHEDMFLRDMPLCLKNPGGSIWIRKR